MRFSLPGAAWLCVVLIVARAGALDLDAIVRDAVQPHVEAHEFSGAAVAVYCDKQLHLYYFGTRDADQQVPVDGKTFFEIGSITKTFTGTLLALMIDAGAVQLDTPLQSLLPEGIHAPAFGDRPLLLRDLATHSSGLPRMPGNWRPAKGDAPYVDYDQAKIYEFLNGYTLPRAPGEKYEYSNYATALLGNVLARKAGMAYESMLRKRILSPLHMRSAHIHSSARQLQRLAQGFRYVKDAATTQEKLVPVARWDFDAFGPAGGIRANLTDMAKYLAACLSAKDTPLHRAIREAQQPLFKGSDTMSVGMNWHVVEKPKLGRTLRSHNGQTGGYHCFMGVDTARGEGVVVLTNSNWDSDAPGLSILGGLGSNTSK